MKNPSYYFTHNKESYEVEWEIENKVLFLVFKNYHGDVIGTRNIPLLGAIDETQLKQIVKDYWRSFVKKELKDVID